MEREPSSPERVKQELVMRLRRLKSDWKDGIPDEIKHSTSPDSGWKVQNAWFQVVGGEMANIIMQQHHGEQLISQELFDEIFAYHDRLTGDESPVKQGLTRQEDIDEAESMIDKLLTELER